jgi:hypothetical protein
MVNAIAPATLNSSEHTLAARTYRGRAAFGVTGRHGAMTWETAGKIRGISRNFSISARLAELP